MRTRTRVAMLAAGVALSAVAVINALPDGRPVATLLPVPAPSVAESSTATAAEAASNPAAVSTKPSNPPRGSLTAGAGIRELRTAGNAQNTVIVSAAGGVTAATSEPGKALATTGPDAFTQRYAAAFGLTSEHSLDKDTAQTLPGGDTVTRYQQTAGGLPVLGGQIVVTSHGKQVRSAIAETSGLTPVSTKATVSAATAASTALGSAASQTGLEASALRAGKPALMLYDPALLGAPGAAGLRPTWQVSIVDANGAEVATVLVDALDGKARLTMSERQSGRDRIVCDLANQGVDLNNAATYACTNTSPLGLKLTTRSEGETASDVADVNNVYDMLGAVYDYYKTNFGVSSFDGHGAQLRATVRACYSAYGYVECPYANAYWDGTQFVFGQGFAVDDVVAHEYTHAITEWSSHLAYAYQSGAINEALSDIMGEFFDQQYVAAGEANPSLNWQIGEDLPASVGTLRSMSAPQIYGQPSWVGESPYWYNGESDNGGVHRNSGVANQAAYLIAGGSEGIGNAKSMQLWWRVMHVLPSAADYSVLGAALNSSCAQLIGHFGITATDCAFVNDVVTQTGMTAAGQTINTTGVTRVALCNASAAQPTDTLYFDGFERRGSWPTTNSSYWLNVPGDQAPYQYAFTGVGSLNGWSPSTGGNGTTATMPASVQLPAGGSAFLHFSESTLDPSANAGIYLEMSVNGGAWAAVPATLPTAGGYSLSGKLPQLRGYSDHRLDLTSLAGKSVKFRFRLSTASSTNLFDWYVDNFRIYTCANRPSAPAGYAYYDGKTAVVGGLSTAFVPAGQTLDHYELAYSIPLAGAPTSIPANQGGFTLTETDGAYRTVKVRAVTNTGAASGWTTLLLSATAPRSCQATAYPVWATSSCMTRLPNVRPSDVPLQQR